MLCACGEVDIEEPGQEIRRNFVSHMVGYCSSLFGTPDEGCVDCGSRDHLAGSMECPSPQDHEESHL